MHRMTAMVASALALVLGVAVLTAQEAPSDEYKQAMQNIRAAAQAAGADTPDFAAISQAAQAARDGFLLVQQYWRGKNDDMAAELAAEGAKFAGDLAAAAGLNSAEGVTFAAMQMGETCGACHMAHRTRLEDGTFVIN